MAGRSPVISASVRKTHKTALAGAAAPAKPAVKVKLRVGALLAPTDVVAVRAMKAGKS